MFWFLLIFHRIILYRIENGICGPSEGFYVIYDNYFQVIFSSITPSISMSILSYLLIRNVRAVAQRRIQPVNSVFSSTNQNQSTINQIDAQLTIMLTVESFIAIITYIPYAIELTYSSLTQEWRKTDLWLAWETLFRELIHLLSYTFFATSFYVSMISSVGFRRKMTRLLRAKLHDRSTNHS